MDSTLLYQLAAALGQISTAAAPSDMPHLAQLGQGATQSAQSSIQAEAERKAKEEEEQRRKGDLWSKIGGTVGAAALAPFTGGTSLLATGALGAAGGAAGSALGGALAGGGGSGNVVPSAVMGGLGTMQNAYQQRQQAEQQFNDSLMQRQQYPQLQMPTQNPSPNLPRQQMYNQVQAGTGAGTTASMHSNGQQGYQPPGYFDQFRSGIDSIMNIQGQFNQWTNPSQNGQIYFERDPYDRQLRMR